MSIYTTVRKLLKKRDSEGAVSSSEYVEEEEVLIEEADDEYVLLKVFSRENPQVGFSYAINRIDELKVAVGSLTKEKNALEEMNMALKEDLEQSFQFKDQIEALKDQLISREKELSGKSVELDTLVRKSARIAVERDALTDKLGRKDKQIKGYLDQLEEVKHDPRVIQLEKEKRISEDKVASLEDETRRIRVKLEEQKTSLSVRRGELEQYKQAAASMEAELRTQKASQWEASTKLKEVMRQLEEKEAILSSKEETIEELMVKSRKATLDVDALKKEIDEKTALLADHERRSAEFENKKDGLVKQMEKRDLKIKELEAKVTDALEKGPKLVEAEKRLEELLPLEDDVRKLRIQIEEQKDALNVATSEADQYKQMAASMDAELSSLKANWWETNKQTKSLKEEIEVKDGIIAAKDNTIKELLAKSRSAAEGLDMLKRQMGSGAVTGGESAASAPPQPSKAPPTTEEAQGAPAPKVEEPPAPTREEPVATEKPAAEKPASKVSPNESKIKLLEIERRSILKMLERPGMKDTSLGKKYQRKLVEISLKIEELRQGVMPPAL